MLRKPKQQAYERGREEARRSAAARDAKLRKRRIP
jgi:hypothetical protein